MGADSVSAIHDCIELCSPIRPACLHKRLFRFRHPPLNHPLLQNITLERSSQFTLHGVVPDDGAQHEFIKWNAERYLLGKLIMDDEQRQADREQSADLEDGLLKFAQLFGRCSKSCFAVHGYVVAER